MSTTPSALTTVPTATPVAAPGTHRLPARKRKGLMLVVALAAGAGILGSVGWRASSWFTGNRTLADTNKFIVSPRTFSVVLREKGELKASKSTDIKSEVEGRSTIISLVPEGTAVKEGDLLVELASDQIVDRIRQEELKEANAFTAHEAAKTELEIQLEKNASDIRKAELQIELKDLEFKRYLEGEWQQQKRDCEIAIEQAKIWLDRRKDDYDAAKSLIERKFITPTEFAEDEFNFKKAEWDVEKSENALKVLKEYSHRAELRQKESDLEEAKKEADRVRKNAAAEEVKKQRTLECAEKELSIVRDQLAKLRHQKDKCRITAPTQGFVVYYGGGGGGGMRMMSNDSQIKEGAEVFERQVLMELPDTTEMMVICRIHEAKTDKLRMGQQATIEVEGVPGRRFTGKVSKIAVLADTQNRWLNPDLKEYETEIVLDAMDVPLKPGVTAHVEIMVETIDGKLAVPVQSVYSKGGNRYVFKDSGRSAVPVKVGIGSAGTEWAEVTDGLSEGDQITLAASEEDKRLLPDSPSRDRSFGPPGNAKMTSTPAGAPMARPADGATRPPRGMRQEQQRTGEKPGQGQQRPAATSSSS